MGARSHGGWRFIKDARVLELHDAEGRWRYEVDLDRCRTAAEMMDWIFQIEGKSWATDPIVRGLIRALNELLKPQATLCSGGVERGPIDVAATFQGVAQFRGIVKGLIK
jgi:hypothetical protein